MTCKVIELKGRRRKLRLRNRLYVADAEVHQLAAHQATCGICGSSRHRASSCPLRPTIPASQANADQRQ